MIRIPSSYIETEGKIEKNIISLKGWHYEIFAYDERSKEYIANPIGKCA
jgi:hypothetical protein